MRDNKSPERECPKCQPPESSINLLCSVEGGGGQGLLHFAMSVASTIAAAELQHGDDGKE